ncbi:unnamed protein product [Chondrus crispus]|uniref:Uncharacterized protein n=1 Tax=Chondrus crispus TaxID=2769 RepID=R7QM12_CHOCR|nr:unnamed protein product [Chondrus crispus]CDF39522.1 unnamed protein product [Chondrus crispus]|eukprot:XP_005719433.1 unnamed protein product [Chondrus crispus]
MLFAENKHVKEIVLKVAFRMFTLIYIFLQKKSCTHMRTRAGRMDTK